MKTLTIDPVCGREVNSSGEFGAEYRGVSYLFCCEDCSMRFQRDPGEFTFSEGEELAELPSELELPRAPKRPSRSSFLPIVLLIAFLLLAVLVSWVA